MSVDGGNGFAHLIKKLSTALASESLLNEAVAKNCNSRKSKLIEVLKQKKSGIHETQEHVYNYKEIAAHIVDQLMKNDSKIMRIGREELTDWYIETFGTDVNMDREVVSNIVKRMIEQHRILAECSVEGLSVDSARWTEIKTAWDSRDNSLKKQKKSSNRNTTTIRAQQF
jgi:hypothetical protein